MDNYDKVHQYNDPQYYPYITKQRPLSTFFIHIKKGKQPFLLRILNIRTRLTFPNLVLQLRPWQWQEYKAFFSQILWAPGFVMLAVKMQKDAIMLVLESKVHSQTKKLSEGSFQLDRHLSEWLNNRGSVRAVAILQRQRQVQGAAQRLCGQQN